MGAALATWGLDGAAPEACSHSKLGPKQPQLPAVSLGQVRAAPATYGKLRPEQSPDACVKAPHNACGHGEPGRSSLFTANG